MLHSIHIPSRLTEVQRLKMCIAMWNAKIICCRISGNFSRRKKKEGQWFKCSCSAMSQTGRELNPASQWVIYSPKERVAYWQRRQCLWNQLSTPNTHTHIDQGDTHAHTEPPVMCISHSYIYLRLAVPVSHMNEWEQEIAPASLFSALRGTSVFVLKHSGV